MQGPIARLCERRKKPLPVAMDRVEARSLHTPALSAVKKGRAVPPLRAGYPGWEPYRGRNDPGEGPLRLSRALGPETAAVAPPAGRGSGRAGMARLCGRHLKPRSPIRIKSGVATDRPR